MTHKFPIKAICIGSALSISVLAGAFSSEMNISSVSKVCNAVMGYQIFNHDQIYRNTLDWTNGAMFRGMVEWGIQNGDESPLRYLYGIGEANGWQLCYIPNCGRYHADDICIAQSYLELFRLYGNPMMIAPAKERVYYIATHPSNAPLRKDDALGTKERWSWCDALFMAPPVFAALYSLTGEQLYSDYLESEFWACTDSLYDRSEHLFYRDCTMIPQREPNGRKMFWSRGNGWVAAGIPLILENLPTGYPGRSKYETLFIELMDAVVECQDEKGSWHASMLDREHYNAPENSSSAFFCYALAYGINHGLLTGRRYRTALEKGWKALVGFVNNEGRIGYVQQIGHAPVTVKAEETENYAVGALLLAGSEICRLLGEKPVLR